MVPAVINPACETYLWRHIVFRTFTISLASLHCISYTYLVNGEILTRVWNKVATARS